MRAVRKLERRFNFALAKLDASSDEGDAVEKIAKLSKQIENLEAQSAEKDTRIAALQSEIVTATKAATDSAKELTEIKKAEAVAEGSINDLQKNLDIANAEKEDAALQISKLQEKLEKSITSSNEAEEIADLTTKLEASKEVEKAHKNRITELRGALRKIRAGIKDNIVNAEDINIAMKAELEALLVQREKDIKEVNAILTKLSPLVEKK